MTVPFTLTTRRHPIATATYIGQALLGVAYITDFAEPVALDNLMSGVFPLLWSLGITLAGAAAVVSLLVRQPSRGMTVELAGVGTLAGLNTIYVASLFAGYGTGVPITSIAFTSFTIGFGWRAWQLIREMRRLRIVASSPPVLADPPALGEPSGDAKE